MKVVLHHRASPDYLAQLAAAAPDWLEVVVVPEDEDDRLARELPDTEVIWHALEPITAGTFDMAPKLRLVQKIGVGVNTIDLESARAHGVAVANMPGTNTQAVAETALLLMLAALRRLPVVDRATREGRGWALDFETIDAAGELAGRTVGLVGYGAVARSLRPMLEAIGARVVYTTRTGDGGVSLDELLASSDVVSLHCPLTPETDSMIDADAIARMRPGAILVNTARGHLVVDDALVAALKDGHLAAAGIDAFRQEPIDPAHPFLGLDNVVVMPHLAWRTHETIERSLVVAFENCRRLRDGEPLLHQVV